MEIGRSSSCKITAYRWVALFLGFIYVCSAVGHLINLERFFLSVHRYQIVHSSLVLHAGLLLLVLMLFSGTGLLLTDRNVVFSSTALVVGTLLSVAISFAWYRGIDISCGCVIGERKIDWAAVGKPISLMFSSLFLTLGFISDAKT